MSWRRGYGFTFIELIIVILILGIIAGIAIPSFRDFQNTSYLEEATQEIVTALRYARALAIKRDTSILVDFDPLLDRCSILKGYVSTGNNTLTFDNTYNPPQSDPWGVRNVKVVDGVTVLLDDPTPYGNIPGGDTSHIDKVTYNFSGSGEHLRLFFSLYDGDTKDEVKIYLNGIEISNGGKGPDNGWTKTRVISLPSIITGDNSIINEIDKKPYVIDFQNSPYLKGIDIVSATFGTSHDVIFYRDGSPSSGGTIVLSYRGLTKNINVEPGTGYVSVQ